MQAFHDKTVRVNSGHAWEMKTGQRVRITFQSIVDFVVFNLDNLHERFDQARTKANQGKIYLSTGDQLLAKPGSGQFIKRARPNEELKPAALARA